MNPLALLYVMWIDRNANAMGSKRAHFPVPMVSGGRPSTRSQPRLGMETPRLRRRTSHRLGGTQSLGPQSLW